MSKTDEHWMYSSIIICSIVIINDFCTRKCFMHNVYDTVFSHKASFSLEDIFATCFLHWILTCYSMQLKNAGACIWISLQRFTLKYIMNTYDGKLYLEPTLVSQTSGHFQLMFVTYFAANVLKCTDIHVQAHNSIFVIMVILWNGCIFLCIAFSRLFVYLNWVNLLCRSIWPHCPFMVQCNTVYYWPAPTFMLIYHIYLHSISAAVNISFMPINT